MATIYKKSKKIFGFPVPKKKRRKRRKSGSHPLFFSVILFFVIIFIGGATVTFFANNGDSKNEVKVSGIDSTLVQEAEIVDAVNDISTFSYSFLGKEFRFDNFLITEQKKIEMLMEKFPQIEGVEFVKEANILSLKIKEKEPVVVWCEEKCLLLGSDNSNIGEYHEEDEYKSLPLIKNDSWDNSVDYRRKILDYTCKISHVLSDIQQFESQRYVVYSDKLVVKGTANCELIFNPKEDIDWQLEKMGTVIKKDDFLSNLQEYSYIDFRFKNQVIIK